MHDVAVKQQWFGTFSPTGLRKSSPNVTIFFFEKFQSQFDSLYLSHSEVPILSVFLCFCHVYLLPVMVNKDAY